MNNDLTIQILAVNVSQPKLLGHRKGKPVMSGIAKLPVTADTIAIGPLNLDGDGQADLGAHGGPDKAVYVYPSEHLPAWRAELGYGDGPAPFGENLSTAGMVETEARIGDIWRWGTATLQVAQPRWPCYKLAMHSANAFLLKHVIATRRTGWYLRVLEPGLAATDAAISVTPDPAGLTVWDAFTAGQGLGPLETAMRLSDHPALAERVRSNLRQRVAIEHAALA